MLPNAHPCISTPTSCSTSSAMCYDLICQQFALHLHAPVLTFGNPSAPRPWRIVTWGRHLDEAGRSTEAIMKRLVCIILVVAGGWLLSSKPMCDWKAKRQMISRRREAVMARLIEFYVPARFQKRPPLISPLQKGKVIVFCAETKKPA